jgi:hypothetical protein
MLHIAVEQARPGDVLVVPPARIDLLVDVIPAANLLFGSEMIGAVRGVDPRTGRHFDDTRRYLDACSLDDEARQRVFEATPGACTRDCARRMGRATSAWPSHRTIVKLPEEPFLHRNDSQ